MAERSFKSKLILGIRCATPVLSLRALYCKLVDLGCIRREEIQFSPCTGRSKLSTGIVVPLSDFWASRIPLLILSSREWTATVATASWKMVSQKSHRSYHSHQLVNLLRVLSQANEAALYNPIMFQSCSTGVASKLLV